MGSSANSNEAISIGTVTLCYACHAAAFQGLDTNDIETGCARTQGLFHLSSNNR